MFQVGKAVVTSNAKVIFAKGKNGNPPVAFVNLDMVKRALSAAGIYSDALDILHMEALVELSQFTRENGF